MKLVGIIILTIFMLIGCGEKEVRPICPKVKVKKVSFKVDKDGGLNRYERKKAFAIINYYTVENTRNNKLIDELNKR